MKHLFLLITLLATSLSVLANDPPPPKPDPGSVGVGVGVGVGTGGESSSESSSSSGASAVANQSASASGGRANSDSYNANNVDAANNSKFLSLALPQPVWVQLPQASNCMASRSKAWAIGWNFFSTAEAGQASDPSCIGMELAQRAYLHCHFESEYMITNEIYKKSFPGAADLPRPDGLKNYSLADCEQMRNPRLQAASHISPPVVPIVQQPAAAPDTMNCEINTTEAARPAAVAPSKRRVARSIPTSGRCVQ